VKKVFGNTIVFDSLLSLGMQEPQLYVTPHGQMTEEQFSKNGGNNKKVYVVVKNIGFSFDIQANFDLTKAGLIAKLLYDFDNEKEKLEVGYVKTEPFEYKVNMLDNGSKASVEVKIKVLTSQHEDMLFRIKIAGTDPITHRVVECFTQPIKVISKLAPPKSKQGKEQLSPPTKKRTSNDQISNLLQRLEQQQMDQMKVIQLLFSRLFGEVITSQQMNLQTLSTLVSQNSTSLDVDGENDPEEFEVSFWKLAQSLSDLSSDAKVTKVEEMLKRLPPDHAEKIYEFLDLFSTAHTTKRYRADKS